MKYFKNTELARIYKVSEKSVRNWIERAQNKKLDLELFKENDRLYVANTAKNTTVIDELVAKGKKFKNSRGSKVVTPAKSFYKIYELRQILDIISNLHIHHEIPTQYSYFDGAAKFWDSYAKRLSNEHTPNILNKTIELLDEAADNIDRLLVDEKKINVIDLGPGNGIPIRSFLERFVKQGRLNRYIAIDASKEMLEIVRHNIQKWFGDKVPFEGHVRDFSQERFDDIFADDNLQEEAESPTNIVLFLGNTLNNFRSPEQVLYVINSSLGLKDLLIYSCYLDTSSHRRYFDFAGSSAKKEKFRSELILEHLGIDESLYEIDLRFDEMKQTRYILMIPKVDISIEFRLPNGARHIELVKSEPVVLWRGRHQSAISILNQFDESDFDFLQAIKSREQQYLLLISKIKTSY